MAGTMHYQPHFTPECFGLNGVRPRWPEQYSRKFSTALFDSESQWSPA